MLNILALCMILARPWKFSLALCMRLAHTMIGTFSCMRFSYHGDFMIPKVDLHWVAGSALDFPWDCKRTRQSWCHRPLGRALSWSTHQTPCKLWMKSSKRERLSHHFVEGHLEGRLLGKGRLLDTHPLTVVHLSFCKGRNIFTKVRSEKFRNNVNEN